MESDQYLIVYWDTETGGDPGWVWTLHDRNGTVIERGLVGELGRDDVTGAQAAVAQQRGCSLVWQAGQQPDVVAFVGRPVPTGAAAPTKRRGRVLADADVTASDAAVTADDIRALAQGEDTVEGLAIEDLAGKAFRFARRTSTRLRARRKTPSRNREPTPQPTDTDPGERPKHY